jgi:hypothetical protein
MKREWLDSRGMLSLAVLTAATRYRQSFGMAMTLAVMGYHFHVMTERLSER